MKTDERTFSDYVAMLKRRRRVAGALGGSILLGFIVAAFTLPAVYESSAIIQIQRPQIPEEMVKTTVASYAEELLASVTQQVLTTGNIIELIERFELYGDRKKSEPIDNLVADFRKNTQVVPSIASAAGPYGRNMNVTYAFTVSFRYSDAEIAAAVANELADLHVKVNSALRADTAAKTSSFLAAETERLQRLISDLETQIASLHGGVSGGFLAQNPMLAAQRYEQMDRELAQIEQSLRSARERRDLIASEVSETPRYRPTLSGGQPIMGGADRLAAAQQELVALLGRYNENHPDVVRLQREIAVLTAGSSGSGVPATELRASLRNSEQELAAARQKYSEDHPDVVALKRTVESLQARVAQAESSSVSGSSIMSQADNPAYLQLMTRLRSADQEIVDLTNRRGELYSRMNRYTTSPETESAYNSLVQERDVLKEEHRQLREKLSDASLAEMVESEQKGQILTKIEPARAATFPIEPNRVMLVFLGLVLGLSAAFGAASLADAMDTRIRGQRDVEALLNMTPMAMIPFIDTPDDIRRHTRSKILTATAITVLLAGALIFVLAN